MVKTGFPAKVACLIASGGASAHIVALTMVDADGPGFVGVLLVLVVMYVLGVYLDCYLKPPSTPATPTTPTNFKRCSVCQKPKGEEDFSKKQWKAKQVRRCIACATPAVAGPSPELQELAERLRRIRVAEAETAARRAAQRARRVETTATQRTMRVDETKLELLRGVGRRWAPVEPGVSVRVAAARRARGAKRKAQYHAVRGKHTVDTLDDFNVWTEIFEEENWDPDSESLDQILGDHLALSVGTLERDLPYMRRNLGGAHPDVLWFEEILLEARAALRAREASRLAR